MSQQQKIKVLLVEDETALAMIISDTLSDEGFLVTSVTDGLKGLSSFLTNKPDVVVADVMMPNMDGFEMVKKMRSKDKGTPVLFLTARSSLDDLVNGFELGANDYLKKPFKMLELVVRIKALVNRSIKQEVSEETVFQLGEYLFNATTQLLQFAGKSVELSHFESEILKRLCQQRNQTVQINDLLNDLWGNDIFYNRNSLHVFIYKLRKLLSKDEKIKILNLRGFGYKLIIGDK
ncbi:MAG: response regulator transcription factor [Bacteroidaceae bacterium]|nr:response regulator transcription factor [Bacteroidaceae bacterium]